MQQQSKDQIKTMDGVKTREIKELLKEKILEGVMVTEETTGGSAMTEIEEGTRININKKEDKERTVWIKDIEDNIALLEKDIVKGVEATIATREMAVKTKVTEIEDKGEVVVTEIEDNGEIVVTEIEDNGEIVVTEDKADKGLHHGIEALLLD
jgi:hypothetical protein